MNREIVIFDTNIYVSHYLGYSPLEDLFNEVIDGGKEIQMPSIIVMELMWYHEVEMNDEIKAARQGYIETADKIIDITKDIALKAAEIRRKWNIETGKKLKHGDALIAASAIIHNATMYSNNDRDFNYIKENFNLKYINPINATELEMYKKSINYK